MPASALCDPSLSGRHKQHKGRAKHYLNPEEVREQEQRKKREEDWKVRLENIEEGVIPYRDVEVLQPLTFCVHRFSLQSARRVYKLTNQTKRRRRVGVVMRAVLWEELATHTSLRGICLLVAAVMKNRVMMTLVIR